MQSPIGFWNRIKKPVTIVITGFKLSDKLFRFDLIFRFK